MSGTLLLLYVTVLSYVNHTEKESLYLLLFQYFQFSWWESKISLKRIDDDGGCSKQERSPNLEISRVAGLDQNL